MTSTAPSRLRELPPTEETQSLDDLRLSDWHHKRARAIREYGQLPPPLLGTGIFRILSNGGDCLDDQITRSTFDYPPLAGRNSYRHYHAA